MKTQTQFDAPQKALSLFRFPKQHEQSALQAWDSADEYMLKHVDELVAQQACTGDNAKEKTDASICLTHNIAIFNDDFGTLACALSEYKPVSFTDSYMAERAAISNADRNDLPTPRVKNVLSLADTTHAQHAEETVFSLVLVKIPRTLALLEQELILLQSHIDESTVFIAAGKVKAVTKNVLALFEKYIGATRTSLAVKKSRLIFTRPEAGIYTASDPKHSELFPSVVDDACIDFSLYNHANVFCREHLDIGARVLLENIAEDKLIQNEQIECIDLGCGNGVLGTAFALANPNSHVSFVDESYMALASAELSFKHAIKAYKAKFEGAIPIASFHIAHCLNTLLAELANEQRGKADIVLCNPPFHQQNVILEDIAWQMFVDAKKILKHKAQLRVVANRHLDHHTKLKRIFGNCTVINSNRKFVVLQAIKL